MNSSHLSVSSSFSGSMLSPIVNEDMDAKYNDFSSSLSGLITPTGMMKDRVRSREEMETTSSLIVFPSSSRKYPKLESNHAEVKQNNDNNNDIQTRGISDCENATIENEFKIENEQSCDEFEVDINIIGSDMNMDRDQQQEDAKECNSMQDEGEDEEIDSSGSDHSESSSAEDNEEKEDEEEESESELDDQDSEENSDADDETEEPDGNEESNDEDNEDDNNEDDDTCEEREDRDAKESETGSEDDNEVEKGDEKHEEKADTPVVCAHDNNNEMDARGIINSSHVSATPSPTVPSSQVYQSIEDALSKDTFSTLVDSLLCNSAIELTDKLCRRLLNSITAPHELPEATQLYNNFIYLSQQVSTFPKILLRWLYHGDNIEHFLSPDVSAVYGPWIQLAVKDISDVTLLTNCIQKSANHRNPTAIQILHSQLKKINSNIANSYNNFLSITAPTDADMEEADIQDEVKQIMEDEKEQTMNGDDDDGNDSSWIVNDSDSDFIEQSESDEDNINKDSREFLVHREMFKFLDDCKVSTVTAGIQACERWYNLSKRKRQLEGYSIYKQWVKIKKPKTAANVTFEESKWYFSHRPQRGTTVQLPKFNDRS